MKLLKASFLQPSILLSLSVCFALPAQQPPRNHDPSAMDSTTTDAATPARAMTPEEAAIIDRYLTPVHAQVAGKVDTRTAAAGQGITLQVTDDSTLANGTQLPRGTKLIGRILRAQAYEKDSAASSALLSINIEQAVLKDGKTIPIRCVLRAIASAGGPKVNMADASQDGSRSSRAGIAVPLGSPLGGTSYPVGGSMGGDIGSSGPVSAGPADDGVSSVSPLGGPGSPVGGSANGSAYPGAGRTGVGTTTRGGGNPSPTGAGDPGVGGSSTSIGDRTGAALGQTTTAIPAADPEQPVVQAGVDLHDTPHRTGLPGVMLSGASIAGVSGTLSAFDRNVTLDSSTRLTLGVITR